MTNLEIAGLTTKYWMYISVIYLVLTVLFIIFGAIRVKLIVDVITNKNN